MPASTLPTKSAPTSALLVKIPPPTRENKATEEAPIPNPWITCAVCGSEPKIKYKMPKPRSPIEATVNPIMEPPKKATVKASEAPLSWAAVAVRTLACVAAYIPM